MKFLFVIYNTPFLSLIFSLVGTSITYSQSSTTKIVTPCQTSINIKVGQIDPKFKITEEEIIQVASDAIQEWEIEVRKEYSPEKMETITLNFIYNHNSEVGKEDFEWRDKIEHIQNIIQKKRLAYITNLKNLNKEWEGFEEEVNNYDLQRKGWQRKFDKAKLEALELLQRDLLEKEEKLELKRKVVEREYTILNKVRENRDSLIQVYKQRFDLQKDITLGIYERNGNSQFIDIYYFNSPEQLKSILIHEFGHAYGIKHVDNTSSIMRHKIEANGKIKAKLSKADVLALKKACRDYKKK